MNERKIRERTDETLAAGFVRWKRGRRFLGADNRAASCFSRLIWNPLLFDPRRETMPKPRKRLGGAAGPDNKGPAGKHTKTKNPAGALAAMGNSSPEKTSASKNCGKNLSSYWLMKSEPESRLEKGVDVKFSIEDLKAEPKQTACWDGVRNYQFTNGLCSGQCLHTSLGVSAKARNFLRAMKLEQEAFFYHSNCKEPGIAGLVKIVKEAYPDHTQFEKNSPYYDPSSKEDNPKWSMVDVQFVRMMKRYITLAELKTHYQAHKTTGGPLKDMALFTRQRLSVQTLTPEEFYFILSLEEKEPS
ncbi:thymocyte nuclear protein 1 isoform X3 [Mustela putorius furo]|uniref:Thymocyte nuclear protein 1 n=2 Tax=Mustela putorius furo TaxID=9669 RepID=A0A8U0NWR2_MUSPF|nr:thymocyte nuclear protein 1 isoform X3 [Mustela putorius furo]